MAYDVVLSPRAEARLQAIAPELRGYVIDGLIALGNDPVALSRPAPSPPYVPGFQVLHCPPNWREIGHRFSLLFKYMADEQTLWVYSIGHVTFGPARE